MHVLASPRASARPGVVVGDRVKTLNSVWRTGAVLLWKRRYIVCWESSQLAEARRGRSKSAVLVQLKHPATQSSNRTAFSRQRHSSAQQDGLFTSAITHRA